MALADEVRSGPQLACGTAGPAGEHRTHRQRSRQGSRACKLFCMPLSLNATCPRLPREPEWVTRLSGDSDRLGNIPPPPPCSSAYWV